MCRWNSPADRTQGQGYSQPLLCWWFRASGSDSLPLVGSPSRWYRGKLGILGSGPRSSPSLAHCTALPGALTPHRSSAAAPSTTVVFSGRAQKPREAEAGMGNRSRPGNTGESEGEGRESGECGWITRPRSHSPIVSSPTRSRGAWMGILRAIPGPLPVAPEVLTACLLRLPLAFSGPLVLCLCLWIFPLSLFPPLLPSLSLFLSLPMRQSLPPSLSFSFSISLPFCLSISLSP